MISVQTAKQRILSGIVPLETVFIPLEAALGRTLSEPVLSSAGYPVFDNSSVDGFAVRAEDVSTASPDHPVILQVVGDIPAGSYPHLSLFRGQAARIMTGAPVPVNSDAIVMIEDTDADPHASGSSVPVKVSIFQSASSGDYIRRHGSDFISGQQILPAEKVLRPQDIGILAMLGVAKIPVRRKPRIALLSSGDELVPIDKALQPGKIHDSNSFMLDALAQKNGCETINIGVAPDQPEAIREYLKKAADIKPDLIISSAGISVGAFDFIRDAVTEHGSLSFWKVNMRPGKPLAYGTYFTIPFFGLPGNPVSAFVSFLVFVQPVLDRLIGYESVNSTRTKVILSQGIESDGRESYLRAVVKRENDRSIATLTGHQGSGNLFSLVQANALLIIPSGVKSCPPGSEVEAWILEN